MAAQNKAEKERLEKERLEKEQAESLKAIEDLGAGLDKAVFAGVCEKMKWRPGKKVKQAEFESAVSLFMKAPIDGRKVK